MLYIIMLAFLPKIVHSVRKGKWKMTEESPQSFPRFPPPDPVEIVLEIIKLELGKEGINIQQINLDGNVITVTTDKKVPEEIISKICQCASAYGLTIKFLTSG